MAHITISLRFPDGETIGVTAGGKTSYPDALHELAHEALATFKEAVDHTMRVEGMTEPESTE